jgi:peptide/nickel transport system permease protein
MSVPVFWLGVMLSRLFGVELGWFPVSGYGDTFAEHLHHLFLPAVSTAAWLVPLLVRNLRAAILEEMEADYVTAGRAKGLPEGYLFRRHILMNSVLPTLHLLGVMVAFLIGSSVVVEIVYAVPGLGALLVGSVIGRDYLVLQALTLVYALGTVLVTLGVDILSALIDPRVKL